jgi:hypothetical protein
VDLVGSVTLKFCKSRVLRHEKEIAHCAVCYDVDGLIFFVARKPHEISGGAN